MGTGSSCRFTLCAAVVLAAGCEPMPEPFGETGLFDVRAEVSDVVPTVVTVHVEIADAEAGEIDDVAVAFGAGASLDRAAGAVSDGEGGFLATLFGLKPATEYTYRVEAVLDGGPLTDEERTVTTGPAPPDLPDIEVDRLQPDEATGGFLVTQLISVPSVAAILDADGDYVWWLRDEQAGHPMVHRVRFSGDRGHVLHQTSSSETNEYGEPVLQIRSTTLDGSVHRAISIAGEDHHDFEELPDGTVAVLRSDHIAVDGDEIEGDRIVEIRPDGTEHQVWSLWDDVTYDPDFPTDPEMGWSHANAIDYDPVQDVYYVSVCRFDAIFKIDRGTGELLWRFGGPDSDFATADGSKDLLDEQHQFDVIGDEILVFDNRPDLFDGSRVVRYRLDEATGTATLLWEYQSDPSFSCYALGDVQQLASGNTLVTWSTAGQVEELGKDGAPVWRLNVELGGGIGYVQHLEASDLP